MAVKLSKNQRRGQNAEVLNCKCGGTIKMKSIFKGSVKHFAECGKCGSTSRKPRDLMASPSIRRSLGLI